MKKRTKYIISFVIFIVCILLDVTVLYAQDGVGETNLVKEALKVTPYTFAGYTFAVMLLVLDNIFLRREMKSIQKKMTEVLEHNIKVIESFTDTEKRTLRENNLINKIVDKLEERIKP